MINDNNENINENLEQELEQNSDNNLQEGILNDNTKNSNVVADNITNDPSTGWHGLKDIPDWFRLKVISGSCP